jgi:hypothetical protein
MMSASFQALPSDLQTAASSISLLPVSMQTPVTSIETNGGRSTWLWATKAANSCLLYSLRADLIENTASRDLFCCWVQNHCRGNQLLRVVYQLLPCNRDVFWLSDIMSQYHLLMRCGHTESFITHMRNIITFLNSLVHEYPWHWSSFKPLYTLSIRICKLIYSLKTAHPIYWDLEDDYSPVHQYSLEKLLIWTKFTKKQFSFHWFLNFCHFKLLKMMHSVKTYWSSCPL